MTPCTKLAEKSESPAAVPSEADTTSVESDTKVAGEVGELKQKIAQFATAELSADLSSLPESEKQVLHLLIEAASYLDPVFDRQAWEKNPELAAQLAGAKDDLGRAKAEYFSIMRGPWDRQAHHEPFAVEQPRPPGGGFYPEDLTAAQFEQYVQAHPEQRDALQSLFTVVDGTKEALVARPYHEVYSAWLVPAAKKMEEAAALTQNASLATFLRSRAAAFRNDDYYVSDKDWMDLDSRVEITIGPYETYEDQLLGLKASYEAFVTVSDPEASAALTRFKALLPDMEQHLPLDEQYKTKRGAESPIRVVDIVYTSGDARKSIQTIAFNLPNDERVRAEKGAKKVLLRNLIKAKFEHIMRPIGESILAPQHRADLSGEAFFQEVLFHELSHSLGPAFTTVNGEKKEIRLALGAHYSALEEAKADVMGAYNILYMIERGEFPESFRRPLLVTYFAGLFRSVRFGVSEAHGQGAALQINRFLRAGVAHWDEAAAGFRIDEAALAKEIGALVHDLCMVQANGDPQVAKVLLASDGVVTPGIARALGQLGAIPVDIRPVYPLAGEKGPRTLSP